MEVTENYQFVSTCQVPKKMQCYNSPFYSSCNFLDSKNRLRLAKRPDRGKQFCTINGVNTSRLSLPNSQSVPEKPIFYNNPLEVSPYSTLKQHFEYLKLPVPFPALPFTHMAEKTRCGFLDTSLLREITRKLNISHFQHICYSLLHAFSTSCRAYMMENDTMDMTSMKSDANLEKGFGVKAENSPVQKFCENITKPEVTFCSNYESEKLCTIMSGTVSCSSTAAVEMLHGINSLKDLDKKLIDRKQRQVNKHSKKRKRRIKKRNKLASMSTCSLEKDGDDSIMKDTHQDEVCQVTGNQKFYNSSASEKTKSVFHDWEDSDDDLCIVFEDVVDCDARILSENREPHCAVISEVPDSWIEFESLTIISGSNCLTKASNTHITEFLSQCDSDSEYETDCGQVFVDTDEFDSWSDLFFVNNVFGCSGLPSDEQGPSFVSRTCVYEAPTLHDEIETCEIREVNKRWKEMTYEIGGEPRLPQRVTFAPEDDLITVYPADMIDRKSEWEQFANERFRFKRRIDEFEKIIIPYLTPAHREKVLRKMDVAAS